MAVGYRRRTPVILPFNVTAGEKISYGDPLWWNGTTLKRVGGGASYLVKAWTNESEARRLAASRFAGIADFEFTGKEDFDKVVGVKSGAEFELPCDSTTWYLGDLVGFVKDSGGNYLAQQKVTKVHHPADAIGYCVEAATNATTCRFVAISAFDYSMRLQDLVQHLALPAADLSVAGDVVTDFTFPTRVKLLAIEAIVTAAFTGTSVVSVKKGATTLADTLSVTGSVGAKVRAEFDDATDIANGNTILDPDDLMDVSSDGAATAGSAALTLEYMAVPLLS